MLQAKCTVRVLALMVMASLLASCASKYPPAPATATSPDYRYVIGPLDTINVIVWRNPELSLAVPVRPDGRITTPSSRTFPRWAAILPNWLAISSGHWRNTFATR